MIKDLMEKYGIEKPGVIAKVIGVKPQTFYSRRILQEDGSYLPDYDKWEKWVLSNSEGRTLEEVIETSSKLQKGEISLMELKFKIGDKVKYDTARYSNGEVEEYTVECTLVSSVNESGSVQIKKEGSDEISFVKADILYK